MRADLREIAKVDAEAAVCTFAQVALQMARQVDDPGIAASQRTSSSRVLVDTMAKLRALVAEKKAPPASRLDEIRARREARQSDGRRVTRAVSE